MTFISYAQNYEDLILWRALKHLEKGFYIDVGANDPVIESVTKAFYEKGWMGINVEPLPLHYKDLVIDRPRDVNLQCAAGAHSGEIDVWECNVRGWATVSNEVIKKHTAQGFDGVFHKVNVMPLREICSRYVQGDIHFLKIDVEGFEKTVIEGMDLKRFRPWIMVIEATKPNSIEEIHSEWEALIVTNDYDLVYSDGLNRYYLAKEHAELSDKFKYPPNIFDDYIRIDQIKSNLKAQEADVKAQRAEAEAQRAEAEAQRAEAEAQRAEAVAQRAEAKAQQAEAKAQQAEAKAKQAEIDSQQFLTQIHAVYGSRSWRITAPLRWLYGQARRLRQEGLKARIKAFIKKVLIKINHELLFHPGLRKQLIRWFKKLGCEAWLKSLHAKAHGQHSPSRGLGSGQSLLTSQLENLPPRSQQIYDNLKIAIELQKQGGK